MKFPDLPAADVLAAVGRAWDLTGALPVPLGEWLACPVCRAPEPQPRHWRFHEHGTTHPWRCDVSFKCTACSAVWFHGLAVPAEMYHRHGTRRPTHRVIDWREARQLLEGGETP